MVVEGRRNEKICRYVCDVCVDMWKLSIHHPQFPHLSAVFLPASSDPAAESTTTPSVEVFPSAVLCTHQNTIRSTSGIDSITPQFSLLASIESNKTVWLICLQLLLISFICYNETRQHNNQIYNSIEHCASSHFCQSFMLLFLIKLTVAYNKQSLSF